MSYGLGFYEFFLLAEDLGAAPVPVLNCGLFCQMRGRGPVAMDDPLFAQYVRDMLDLVEFCHGGADTTWGKVRVSLGHPEPFDLRMVAIGNENWGPAYFGRYEILSRAVKAIFWARSGRPRSSMVFQRIIWCGSHTVPFQ